MLGIGEGEVEIEDQLTHALGLDSLRALQEDGSPQCNERAVSLPEEDFISLRMARTLTGLTEVGSLFLHPEHRASGAGMRDGFIKNCLDFLDFPRAE